MKEFRSTGYFLPDTCNHYEKDIFLALSHTVFCFFLRSSSSDIRKSEYVGTLQQVDRFLMYCNV